MERTERTESQRGFPRVRITFAPQWKGEIEGWARNYAEKALWRLHPVYDLDDFMQEAWLVYQRIVDRYPEIIEPPHFMALFKTALHNWVHTESIRVSRVRVRAQQIHDPETGLLHEAIAAAVDPKGVTRQQELELRLLLADSPDALARLFEMALADALPPMKRQPGGHRESTDDYLRRVGPPHMTRGDGGVRETTSEYLTRVGPDAEPGAYPDRIRALLTGRKLDLCIRSARVSTSTSPTTLAATPGPALTSMVTPGSSKLRCKPPR